MFNGSKYIRSCHVLVYINVMQCNLEALESLNPTKGINTNVLSRGLVTPLFWGLMALSDSISVYIGPSPINREKEKRNDR